MFFNLDPSTLISRIVVLVIAFTVHEFAHAWTADRFGDDTPRYNGRLTLNPLSHLDPMGSLLLLFAGFGWAKPVPVNPYALGRRSPAAMMWVSLAGPASNFIMALMAAVVFRSGLVNVATAFNDAYGRGPQLLPTFPQIMWEFISINLLLMVFNLIPLAPLDGDKIADYFLPPPLSRALETIRPYGPIILISIIFVGPMLGIDILGALVWQPMYAILRILVG